MTIHAVVSVFDSAARTYGRPFVVASRAVGIRSFRDEVNRKHDENLMYQHPSDFELRSLGCFNDESGLFSRLENEPELLARGLDVREESK